MTDTNYGGEKRFGPPIGAILGTVLGVVAWLVFIILYALVWSKNFNLFQNVIVTIASFLIAGLLIAVMWITWIFSKGRKYWWNKEDRTTPNYGGKKEILKIGQRFGEVFGVVVILLIMAFFVYNQIANTGFFTSGFGQWAMFAFYGSILLSLVLPLARAVIGARHPVRPLEAASNIFSIFAALYLLTIFPFNFAHFADALPSTVKFAFSWISNDIAKLGLMLIILGSMMSAVVNIVKYMTFYANWNVFTGGKNVTSRPTPSRTLK